MASTAEKLEQILNFFVTKALAVPWRISQQVSVHLSVEILTFIASKWSSFEPHVRSGFLMALLLVPRRKLRIELKGNAVQLCALGLEDDNKYILMLASMLKGFIDTDLLDLDAASQYLPILPKLLSEFDSALFYFHSEDLKYLQPSIVQQVAAKSDPQVILSFSPEHSLPSQDERLKSYGMADTDLSGKTISPPSSNLNSPVKKHQRPSQPLGIPKRRSLPASSAVLSQLDRTSIPPGMGAFSHNDGPKGFRKPSKIKMMELNESADLKKSVDDAKRKLESDTKAEKERKAREKEMEIQARKGARVAAAEEKRLSKIRIEEDRIQKQNERELKRKQREDDVEEQKRKSLFTLPPAQPVIPEAAVASSSNIEHVLDGAIGVSEIDVQLIDEFLHVKHEEEKTIKLSERSFIDVNGDRKKEVLTIVLDYFNCKWRKVKRTARDK